MKKKLLIILVILAFLGASFLGIFMFAEEIVSAKNFLRVYSIDLFYAMIRSKDETLSEQYAEYPTFTHRGDEWYLHTPLIHHACGGIDGLPYTNSKEALENTMQKGNFIEVDFRYTEDGHLVCAHTWTDIAETATRPTLNEFLSAKICGKYTPMTAEDIIAYMAEYEDLYIVIDTKESNHLKVIKHLVNLCPDSDIANRFIIQLYDKGIKAEILKLYPFPEENFLFTIYKYGTNFQNILKVCTEENISVVTLPYGTWNTDIIELFSEKGIILFEHTVNRPDEARTSLANGISGLYTDFLQVEDLSE